MRGLAEIRSRSAKSSGAIPGAISRRVASESPCFWCKFCVFDASSGASTPVFSRRPVGSAYNGLEQRTLPIVFKINIRPCLKSAQNAGADAVVGQKPLGGVRNQDGVADIGIAGFDIGYGQIVRQRAGADDFHAVIKNENADGRTTR